MTVATYREQMAWAEGLATRTAKGFFKCPGHQQDAIQEARLKVHWLLITKPHAHRGTIGATVYHTIVDEYRKSKPLFVTIEIQDWAPYGYHDTGFDEAIARVDAEADRAERKTKAREARARNMARVNAANRAKAIERRTNPFFTWQTKYQRKGKEARVA